MRIQEAVNQFLEDLRVDQRSPHTIAAYRRDLLAFTSFAGIVPIDTLTPAHLTAFMASQAVQVRPCGTPRAKASINRYRVSLKALFAWCEARWLIDRNPTVILKCKRHRAVPPELLTEKECGRLASFSFEGKWAGRDRALILLMLGTGCRLGEMASLNVGDIRWDSGTLLLRCPKGGEPDQVTAGDELLRLIKPLASGTELVQPLFRNARGQRLSHRQIQRIVNLRCLQAGITKRVTPHILRHTFATWLYNATGDIRLVQKALRHEHVTTTETYAQVLPQRILSAVNSCRFFSTSDANAHA